MLSQLTTAALVGMAAVADAQVRGFNYGALGANNVAKTQQDFQSEFNQAKNLQGVENQFTSARLFTMIQGGSANTVISAIPAAIATNTRLLLGLWASQDQAGFDNELTALRNAISQYGPQIAPLLDGISVGSEDLYRISPTGIENMSGIGQSPSVVADYIRQVRGVLQGSALSSARVGHVDTWTAYVNGSNQAVIDAVDFVGMDAYPYFQNTIANSINDGASVFNSALQATIGAAGGKDVWVTETGWPVSGPQENQAVASVDNAGRYWQDVACSLLGVRNTWWYILNDAGASPSFGVINNGGETPLYPLTCSNKASASSSAAQQTANPSKPAGSVPAPAPGPAQSTTQAQPAPTTLATSAKPASSYAAAPAAPAPAGSSQAAPAPAPAGSSQAAPAPAPAGSSQAAPAPASSTSAASAPASSQGASSSATQLTGAYEYPHLIVPVDKSQPNKAYGTSYNGKVTSDISSVYNFDIPQSLSGKTCNLVFLFPEQKDLTTSSFTTSGSGGMDVTKLKSPADSSTTYANCPAIESEAGKIASVMPGNSYVVSSGPCAAGQRVGYRASSTGSLSLDYFQDYNPSPIGFYITTN